MASRDPEWAEQQRAWMLALHEYRARLCPVCGRPLSVCANPETESSWVAGPPVRCHASTAGERAREPYQGGKAKYPGALMFSATLQVPS